MKASKEQSQSTAEHVHSFVFFYVDPCKFHTMESRGCSKPLKVDRTFRAEHSCGSYSASSQFSILGPYPFGALRFGCVSQGTRRSCTTPGSSMRLPAPRSSTTSVRPTAPGRAAWMFFATSCFFFWHGYLCFLWTRFGDSMLVYQGVVVFWADLKGCDGIWFCILLAYSY